MPKPIKQLQPLVIDLSRVQPHSEDVEKSTLGVIMSVRGALLKVNGIIKEDTFYFDYHGVIYRAILNLFEKDSPIDTLMVTEELKKMGKLNGETITESYIISLTRGVVTDASLEVWVRKLEEYAIARRNIQIHLNAVERYYRNDEDVFEVSMETDTLLFAARNALDSYKNISMTRIGQDFKDHIEKAKSKKGMTGVPTGVRAIDEIMGGWQPQTVNTIGALPRIGKSAVAASFMYESAINGDPVGFCSMEMRDIELYSRLVSLHIYKTHEIKIEYSKINRGLFSIHEEEIIHQAIKELDQLPIFIDDVPALNSMQLKSKTMKLINDKGIKCMYIDYVQLMERQTQGGFTNTAENISQNMRDIKKIAKALNIAMLPLSQVDRNVGKRPGAGKATMQDLKGSGGIEESSDSILLLDRPEVYDPDDYSEKGMLHIVIAKHKMGETGEVVLPYDLSINSFFEQSFEEQSSAYIQKTGYIPQPPAASKAKYEPRFNYVSKEFNDKDDDAPF